MTTICMNEEYMKALLIDSFTYIREAEKELGASISDLGDSEDVLSMIVDNFIEQLKDMERGDLPPEPL